ncbi:MAG: hypothetical protein OJF61_001297 [Rhodanobacteraceae bacterium]|nr:MAG: hypothetical protein OJF61_001297 [Rhodanobacteraceae bacterium]
MRLGCTDIGPAEIDAIADTSSTSKPAAPTASAECLAQLTPRDLDRTLFWFFFAERVTFPHRRTGATT